MLTRLLINNLIVFGVYFGTGVITLLCSIFMLSYSEGHKRFKNSKNPFVLLLLLLASLVAVFGGYVIHYMSGRYLLYSTGNSFIDCTSFILLAIITVVIICFYEVVSREMLQKPKSFFNTLMTVFDSPSFFLGTIMQSSTGRNHDKLSLCITVLFYILLQFIGIVTRTT